jgi:hypothetical protein
MYFYETEIDAMIRSEREEERRLNAINDAGLEERYNIEDSGYPRYGTQECEEWLVQCERDEEGW